MELKISGRVVELLDVQSGEGKNGPWKKQDFILETDGNYPKTVCITQWGDDIDTFALSEGDRLTAHIDLRSREYNGRWYTDVKAWKVEKDDAERAGPGVDPGGPMDPSTDFGADHDDGLPF